ncbi:MAG TPA: choice-of-anchor D domain-containing protein, partial [Candidatus Cloacimonadota bacterium]|nr:choice-of-anchor D domain-containing protein [Candidatus Cloacimonadota bacterium]
TSFIPVHTVSLSSSFAEYILNFSAYTGTGRFIAFKHTQTNSYITNYLDTVMLEISPENDLAVLSLSGNTTPSVNNNSTYNVRIINRGSLTQNVYQVALHNASNDVELATAPGLSVAPDEIIEVPIDWTPTVEGPLAMYAKVILAGDQNALNDQCAPINLTVFPENIMATTIGSGDQLNRIPMDFFYRNSLFETLYYPDEMMAFGNITSVSIYNNFVTNLTNMPVKIWMGSTTQDNLSAGWIPATELTLVFDGNVNFPMGENTIIFPLQTPVTYAGGNLVLLMERPMDVTYYSSNDRFRSQTGTQLRSLNVYADGTDYNPAAPPTGVNPISVYPMITFHMTPLSDDPVFLAVPATWDYGTVLLNSVHDKQVRVMNVGGGTLGINSISISDTPHISMLGLPTLPTALATGQVITFTVRYNPTAVGEHNAVITITDDQNVTRRIGMRTDRTAHTLTFGGDCIDPTIVSLPYLQNFDTVTQPALPVQWSTIIGTGATG